MGKFNSAAGNTGRQPDKTYNYEGAPAFKMEAKTRLYSQVVTSLVGEARFYDLTGEAQHNTVLADIARVAVNDPEFILKMAAYARNKMNLRTVPLVLLAEAAMNTNCKPFVRKYSPHILRRADEPGELISYWISRYGEIGRGSTPFPNSLKKGINDALNNFDEYQLEKYNSKKQVNLSDVLRICHPRPRDKTKQAIFNYLLSGEIDRDKMPKVAAKYDFINKDVLDEESLQLIRQGSLTWEVVVSKFGNNKEVWNALNLPFMAMLRNIRNIMKTGGDISSVLERLNDKNAVLKSRQFPFRFLSAYREIERAGSSHHYQTGKILSALSRAIEFSIENMPLLPGNTVIACDNSGSMTMTLSARSAMTFMDIANLLGAIADRFCENSIVGAFGTDWAPVTVIPADSIFTNMNRIEKANTNGMATNAYKVVNWMIENDVQADRLIVISDMQCYDSIGWGINEKTTLAEMVAKYRHTVNADLKVYCVDLLGYGTTQLPPDDSGSVLIAGWTEQIFRLIPAFETNGETAVRIIDDYEC